MFPVSYLRETLSYIVMRTVFPSGAAGDAASVSDHRVRPRAVPAKIGVRGFRMIKVLSNSDAWDSNARNPECFGHQ
jgi:hypothetical protein